MIIQFTQHNVSLQNNEENNQSFVKFWMCHCVWLYAGQSQVFFPIQSRIQLAINQHENC